MFIKVFALGLGFWANAKVLMYYLGLKLLLLIIGIILQLFLPIKLAVLLKSKINLNHFFTG